MSTIELQFKTQASGDRARRPFHTEPLPLFNGATISAAVLATVIFAVDLMTPEVEGVEIEMLYVAPLLVATFSGPPRFQLAAAGVATILTILATLTQPPGTPAGPLIANRTIALTLVWTTAIVLARFRRTWDALQVRSKELADVDHALDQSAIVATTDTAGRITYVNDKFCEISKYSREELLGQDHRMINSGYHPKDFIRNLWVTIANGRIWRGEIRNRARDGSIYWVDTTIVPFIDDRGKPFKYMAIRYEITERKRTEELLREQAALARLGQMAAVVAHEVKNPIAGIRGALQVIGSRMAAENRDRAVVNDIIARLDALNGVVQDLLVFARPRELRSEPVDLRALVTSTADLIMRDPSMQGLRIRVAGADAVAQADREQLQIVFHNILTNAAQAMGGAGDVDVEISRSAEGWSVAFADHGPGMLAEVRDKAFEAFFTTKHRGTGLGLPTARRIVEAHGGQIAIESPPTGGTTVSIVLPTR
ncbi:MAG TPA: ATP-binding protein [Vicinamibacterales bacterium]|jgi:two-component system CheB/CheR fusion protein|nr:ATP-binding protein [Vicinamibacterales bacterium]